MFKQTLGWTRPKLPSASPDPSPLTCAAPGNDPPHQAGSLPPGSAEDFGTYARTAPYPLLRRNPACSLPLACGPLGEGGPESGEHRNQPI